MIGNVRDARGRRKNSRLCKTCSYGFVTKYFWRLADSGPLFFDLAEMKEIGYYKLYEKDNQLLATGGCYGKE